jgi:hypothetical protein
MSILRSAQIRYVHGFMDSLIISVFSMPQYNITNLAKALFGFRSILQIAGIASRYHGRRPAVSKKPPVGPSAGSNASRTGSAAPSSIV